MLLLPHPEAVAQSQVQQLIAPSAKDIDNAAVKVTKKKDDAEVRMILIKNCINEYLSSPGIATGYTSATAAEAADSIKTLNALLRNAANTLAALDDRMNRVEASHSAEADDIASTRDSLQAVLVDITRQKARVDSVSDFYVLETERLHSGIDSMRAEAAALERNNERATRIKDAATAKRSHAATVVDQLNTMETEALRMPLDADFDQVLAEASKLLADNRGILASYGHPQQMAEAERAVNHIAVLARYSRLVDKANKTMASKYDTDAIESARDELQAFYNEHGLDNKDHITTVKTVISQLRDGQLYYRQLSEALDKVRDHNMGWMFRNGGDVPEFNTIIETTNGIPDSYTLMIKARTELVRQLRDSGKSVVRGDELTRIVETIRKHF